MRVMIPILLVSICCSCKTTTPVSPSDTPSLGIDNQDCYPSRKVVYEHEAAEGRIGKVGDYYIIHHNNNTGRLQPCTLPAAFQQEDLKVIFSGDQVEINPGERRFAMPMRLHNIRPAE